MLKSDPNKSRLAIALETIKAEKNSPNKVQN